MRVANLIVIGVSKAGTTSLFDYLGRHPQVGQSDVKELRYFTPVRYRQPTLPVEAYAAHFSALRDEKYAVEATPGYFYGGRELAECVEKVCGPETRVIVSLREPVDRCWSWYRFVKSRMRIPKDMTFDEYVDRCALLRLEGTDGFLVHQAWWGMGGGCYSEWMQDWVDVFENRLAVVFFDDLVQDAEGLLEGLFGWLELDPSQAWLEDLEATNQSAQYRLGSLQRAAVKLNRQGERFWRQHPEIKRRLRAGYQAINKSGDGERMSDSARARLEAFYAPYNERLETQLKGLGFAFPEEWRW